MPPTYPLLPPHPATVAALEQGQTYLGRGPLPTALRAFAVLAVYDQQVCAYDAWSRASGGSAFGGASATLHYAADTAALIAAGVITDPSPIAFPAGTTATVAAKALTKFGISLAEAATSMSAIAGAVADANKAAPARATWPKSLPPGYSRWVPRGWGWAPKYKPEVIAICRPETWGLDKWVIPAISSKSKPKLGFAGSFYLEAIKEPPVVCAPEFEEAFAPLPRVPELPEGFTHWIARGPGWKTEWGDHRVFAYLFPDSIAWSFEASTPTSPSGYPGFYLEACKGPIPGAAVSGVIAPPRKRSHLITLPGIAPAPPVAAAADTADAEVQRAAKTRKKKHSALPLAEWLERCGVTIRELRPCGDVIETRIDQGNRIIIKEFTREQITEFILHLATMISADVTID